MKMPKTEEEWKRKLTSQQYKVLRKKSTELPFSGKYLNNKEKGVYLCAGCGNKLFSSETKYNSGTGWPSFSDAMSHKIKTKQDNSLLMRRKEVLCNRCGGHLGHVFKDGPKPTGLRFCVNSASLNFKKQKSKKSNI